MILILVAIIALTALSIWASTQDFSLFSEVLAPVFAIIGFICLIIYSIVGFNYFAAEHKAKIINREYQTNYTQIEVFYASDVIDTIREIDRRRIELNGDLITGK